MRSGKRKRCPTLSAGGTGGFGEEDEYSAAGLIEQLSTRKSKIWKKEDSDDLNVVIASSTNYHHQAQLITENAHPYFRVDVGGPLVIEPSFYYPNMAPPPAPFLIDYHHQQQQKQQQRNQIPFNFGDNSYLDTNIILSERTNTKIQETQQQNQSTVAAKSSYYSLTPASSTTSLNDLVNNQAANENYAKAKKLAANGASRKRTRGVAVNQQEQHQSQQQNQPPLQMPANAPQKRRGRPPKNQQTQQQQQIPQQAQQTTTENETNRIDKYLEVKQPLPQQQQQIINEPKQANSNLPTTTAATKPKIIKSLMNKTGSNANLQKSKVLTSSPPIEKSAANANPTTNQNSSAGLLKQVDNSQPVLVNNSNCLNLPSVNTKPCVENFEEVNKVLSVSLDENVYSIGLYKGPICKPQAKPQVFELDSRSAESDESPTPMPKLTWANNNDLWDVMRKKDVKYSHDPNYLKRHSNIEPQMRAILLDWLVEISYAYRLHRETWHLALEYMDRFLTCSKQAMRVDRLQLIGMSALFLAAKVEEIYPPKLKDFASHMENYSNNNEDAISQFELFMLKTLNWEISPVTANTWLMTYLQIAAINFEKSERGNGEKGEREEKGEEEPMSTSMVMPLHVFKNTNGTLGKIEGGSERQRQFFLKNYMKCVTLLDLCMFDMESMRFNYSILAAAVLYHMCSTNGGGDGNEAVAGLVQMSTGYKLYELDACIKWMYPYADVCKEIITEEKMTQIKYFSSVDHDDSHNIQLYYQNLELLKEAQSRKTPSKFYSGSNLQALLTPPDSHRKNTSSSMLSNSITNTPTTITTAVTASAANLRK